MATALRAMKLSTLALSSAMGMFRVVENSDWRRRQLLILCYHGISIDDEHLWAPGLYVTPEAFEARLEILRRRRCSVLSLQEGLTRLYDRTLPPRSVVITFDDGNFDFRSQAMPRLQAFGFPATVFLTTYYSDVNVPVFPLVLSYVLWKSSGRTSAFTLPTGEACVLDTSSQQERLRTFEEVTISAQSAGLSAQEKDVIAERVARALGVDYSAIRRRRILHLMNADEVAGIAAAGYDVQLHTHRHRSPPDRVVYGAEITQNRDRIAEITGARPRHFCYPSGAWAPKFAEWLREEGVVSAVTCEPGLATPRTDPFRLPRLLDHSHLTALEFEAWVTGIGAQLPHRYEGSHVTDEKGRPVIRRDEVQHRAAVAGVSP
jgi:peptidoglycan/xylan/chitin deacetylase (PgdA/CDA1 family)